MLERHPSCNAGKAVVCPSKLVIHPDLSDTMGHSNFSSFPAGMHKQMCHRGSLLGLPRAAGACESRGSRGSRPVPVRLH